MPLCLTLPRALTTVFLIFIVGCSSSSPAPNTSVLSSKAPSTPKDAIPKDLQAYIDQMSTSITLMELPDYIAGALPEKITKQQALEDVDVLRYLLDNAYSGRHYWQYRGVDFPKGYENLRRYIKNEKTNDIDTRAFESQIYQTFIGINDPHTAIIGHETSEFFTRIRQYLARFVVAKKGTRFIVVQSAEERVPVGAEFLDAQDKLLPTLSPTDEQHYLFGMMDTTPIETMRVRLNIGEVNVAMHPCRIGNISYDRFENIIELKHIESIPVIRSSSFWVEGKIKELEAFSEMGKTLRNEPMFIWNLLANDGGITQYPAAFIENFNTIQQDAAWMVHLHSTPIAQAYLPGKNGWSSWPAAWLDDATPLESIPAYKRAHVTQVRQEKVDLISNPRRYWKIVGEIPEKKVGDYAGKMIVLSNYRNGSAGNNALAMSKSVPNSLIVGENSNMTYAFANTRNFSLKHSRIKLRLPGRLIINPENSIERGFLPDLWLDSESPVEEVIEWLRRPDTYQFQYKN